MRPSNKKFALEKLSLKTSDYRVLQHGRFALQKLFRSKDALLVEQELAFPWAVSCPGATLCEQPLPKSDLGGKVLWPRSLFCHGHIFMKKSCIIWCVSQTFPILLPDVLKVQCPPERNWTCFSGNVCRMLYLEGRNRNIIPSVPRLYLPSHYESRAVKTLFS